MTYTIKKFLWKRREARRLADEAFRKEAMAIYSESAIGDILTLKKYDEQKIDMLRARIEWNSDDAATGSPVGEVFKNDYERHKFVDGLKKEIADIEVVIKGRDDAVERVKREAETLRAQAQELWHRRKVFHEKF